MACYVAASGSGKNVIPWRRLFAIRQFKSSCRENQELTLREPCTALFLQNRASQNFCEVHCITNQPTGQPDRKDDKRHGPQGFEMILSVPNAPLLLYPL
jgi:hypothetical protein